MNEKFKKIKAILFSLIENKKEFVNDNNKDLLDIKKLSKLLNVNVTDYAISGDFTTICCFTNKKTIFFKMRKYIKAYSNQKLIELASLYKIPQ